MAAVTDLLSIRGKAVEPIGPDTNLETLGLDSLDQAELLVLLEELAGCELDPEPASGFRVVGDLAALRPPKCP